MSNFITGMLKLVMCIALFASVPFITSSWQSAQAATNNVDCNAPTVVCRSGALTVDETWQAGNVYVIISDLTVGPGATLTILPKCRHR